MSRHLARGVLAAALAVVAVTAFATPSGAEAPASYGWWYEANAGLPVAPPAPPSVPSGGLYIENGFNGPSAIAALSFPVAAGAALGPLVLRVAGSPTMSQPPVACGLRSPGFTPAEDGAWSDRPAYDCQKAQSVGKVDASHTTVTFDVSPFLRDGTVAVAILPTGPVDQVAFDKPGPDTLAVTPVAAPPVPAASVDSSPPPAVPSPTGPDVALPPSPLPDAGVPSAVPLPLGSGPTAAATPPAPPSNPSARPSALAASVPSAAIAVGRHVSGWRSGVARILGVAALLFVLVAWTEGYGVLGGRIHPLALPLVRYPRPRVEP